MHSCPYLSMHLVGHTLHPCGVLVSSVLWELSVKYATVASKYLNGMFFRAPCGGEGSTASVVMTELPACPMASGPAWALWPMLLLASGSLGH